MWIQEWIDNQFGVPNTFKTQLLIDFAKEVERREGKRIRQYVQGAINLLFIRKYSATMRQLTKTLEALKGESNE